MTVATLISTEGARVLSKTNEMVGALEVFVIKKVESFDAMTSPEEIAALTELVTAVSKLLHEINLSSLEPVCTTPIEQAIEKLSESVKQINLP